jgi:hypothetical protein
VHDESGQVRSAVSDDRGDLDRVRPLEPAEGDGKARAVARSSTACASRSLSVSGVGVAISPP